MILPFQFVILMVAGSSFTLQAKELTRPFDCTSILGWGGAGRAYTSGQESIFYNPSQLEQTEGNRDIILVSPQGTMSDDAYEASKQDSKYRSLKLKNEEVIKTLNEKTFYAKAQNFTGMILDKAAFGIVSSVRTTLDIGIDLAEPEESHLLAEAVTHNGVVYGLSREVLPDVKAGFLLKGLNKREVYLDRSILESLEVMIGNADGKFDGLLTKGNGNGFGGDVGITYKRDIPYFTSYYALVVQNVGNMNYQGSEKPRPEKQSVDLGTAFATVADKLNFVLAFDLIDIAGASEPNAFKRLHTGLRWDYENIAGASLGLSQGYGTVGAFFRYKFVEIQGARYGVEIGSKPGQKVNLRNSAKVQLGWFF